MAFKKEDFGVIEELREVLGKIAGVKGLTEVLSLSYVLQVDKEEDKAAVAAVANVLTQQATKFGLDLEITAATTAEMEEAKAKFEELMSAKKETSFNFNLGN